MNEWKVIYYVGDNIHDEWSFTVEGSNIKEATTRASWEAALFNGTIVSVALKEWIDRD